jgi:hypothetical protein
MADIDLILGMIGGGGCPESDGSLVPQLAKPAVTAEAEDAAAAAAAAAAAGRSRNPRARSDNANSPTTKRKRESQASKESKEAEDPACTCFVGGLPYVVRCAEPLPPCVSSALVKDTPRLASSPG